MPLYDYICINEKCEQKEFSVLKTGFEDTWEYCPECKEKRNKRKKIYQFSCTMEYIYMQSYGDNKLLRN